VVPIATIAHPEGATDVVLQMDTAGGLVPLTYRLTQVPVFTLYGDRTVIFRPTADAEGNGFPPLAQATMTIEQMDALLLYALDLGGLREARDSYDSRQVTDAPTTTFSIDAHGVDKSVAVHALGMTQPEGDDAAAYEGFLALGGALANFGEQVVLGNALDAGLFQPKEYRAFLSPAQDPSTAAIAWPWSDPSPDDLQPFGDFEGVLFGGLTPGQVAQVTTIPSGGVPSLLVRTPRGTTATLSLRPLLPGEPDDPSTSPAP